MKAPAAITRKPRAFALSASSTSASSYARRPYTASTTAGEPLALTESRKREKTSGILPPKTGAAMTARSCSPKAAASAREVKSKSRASPEMPPATLRATERVLPPGEK